MDSFNPKDNDKILKAYQKVVEMTPYNGMHITHMGQVDHIKKIYGNTYKVVSSPSTNSWYVMGKNGNDWIPVTASFSSKEDANKFMQFLTKSGEIQQKMAGTIDGTDKRLYEEKTMNLKTNKGKVSLKGNDTIEYEAMPGVVRIGKAGSVLKKGVKFKTGGKWMVVEEETLNESAGGHLHGLFGDLFDYLDNNFYGSADDEKIAKEIPKLKKETEKVYKSWQKALKGKGLIGW